MDDKTKIEACNELIGLVQGYECTCKGKMFFCIRCAMLDDVKGELKILQGKDA